MRSGFFVFCFVFSLFNCLAQRSVKYLNQEPPGLTPQIFAPGLVSLKERFEFGSVFSKDGTQLYFAFNVGERAEIWSMKLDSKNTSTSERIVFHHNYSYNDPYLSPDETKLFFISDMPLEGTGEKKDYDIWYIKKTGITWSKPINAGKAINTASNEYYVSFTKTGTMYFSSNVKANEGSKGNYDIYFSPNQKEVFGKATRLGDSVNTKDYEADVFVAYDESYVIFCGDLPAGNGKGDLYISFKKSDGSWTKAKNMGRSINTTGHEFCPFVTKDGKYFFYTSNKDIYWVDAEILKGFR